MARRSGHPLYGAKFCGNKSEKEIHNLDNEKPECQIDEILKTRNAIHFSSLHLARAYGYKKCVKCLGDQGIIQEVYIRT
jgi:hypothetical protein